MKLVKVEMSNIAEEEDFNIALEAMNSVLPPDKRATPASQERLGLLTLIV